LKHAGPAGYQAGGMAALVQAAAGCFAAYQLHAQVVEKGMEDAYGVAASAHTGNYIIGKPAVSLHYLLSGFLANYRLEVAHYHGIGMGPHYRAQQVVRGAHIGHPVADSFVDGILERAAARGDRAHLCAEHFHSDY